MLAIVLKETVLFDPVKAKAVAGVYDVLVIDPPWPMEKIERDERPNQAAFDYPTMSEAEIAAVKLPMAIAQRRTRSFLASQFVGAKDAPVHPAAESARPRREK